MWFSTKKSWGHAHLEYLSFEKASGLALVAFYNQKNLFLKRHFITRNKIIAKCIQSWTKGTLVKRNI